MKRAALMTGTMLDGASPLASVGRVDMLGLPPMDVGWWFGATDSVTITADITEAGRQLVCGPYRSGKTDRMHRLAGLRSDRVPRVICPA